MKTEIPLVEENHPECPNCKERKTVCACLRNICCKCGKPIGNITFTVCDNCWDKEHPPMNPNPQTPTPRCNEAKQQFPFKDEKGLRWIDVIDFETGCQLERELAQTLAFFGAMELPTEVPESYSKIRQERDSLRAELEQVKAVCGDRYPDARILELVHQLRYDKKRAEAACAFLLDALLDVNDWNLTPEQYQQIQEVLTNNKVGQGYLSPESVRELFADELQRKQVLQQRIEQLQHRESKLREALEKIKDKTLCFVAEEIAQQALAEVG